MLDIDVLTKFGEIARDIWNSKATTPNLGLKKETFTCNGRTYLAIEQNPATNSQWARMARKGDKVVQFRDTAANRYVAVAVNGRVQEY